MIWAAEEVRVSPFGCSYLVAPMRTAIVEEMDLAVLVAGHYDLLQPNFLGAVVARLADLTLVPYVNPPAIPDPFQLVLEDCGVRVLRTVHSVFLDQVLVIDGRCHCVHPS